MSNILLVIYKKDITTVVDQFYFIDHGVFQCGYPAERMSRKKIIMKIVAVIV